MANDNLTGAIKHFIETELSGNSVEIGVSDDLLEGSLVDSMGIMRLVAFIEQTYDYSVPAEDVTIENFMTIGAIVEYLAPRVPTTANE